MLREVLANGYVGHLSDHEALAHRYNTLVYDVVVYGADPTGATYSDTAVSNALAAIDALDSTGVNNSKGAVLYFPFGIFKLANTIKLRRGVTARGVSMGFWYGGSVLIFDDGVTGFQSNGVTTTADGGTSAGCMIERLSIKAAGQTVPNADGVFSDCRLTVEYCWITGFSRNGIRIVADTTATPSTIANSWLTRRLYIDHCGADGHYVSGHDTNAGESDKVTVAQCGGWGFTDSSFLGNSYHGAETKANTLGPMQFTGASNAGRVYGGYHESGQGAPATISQGVRIDGGTWGDAPVWASGALVFGGAVAGNQINSGLSIRPNADIDSSISLCSPLGPMTNRSTNAAVTSGTKALSGTFSPALTLADLGRTITVTGAGAAGATLTTTIDAIDTSGSTPGITLHVNASTTVSGATVQTPVAAHSIVIIRNEANTATGAINANGWLGIGTSAPSTPVDVQRAISGDVVNVAGKALTAAGDSASIAITANNSTQNVARIKRYTAASAGNLANALSVETLAVNANILITPHGTGSAIIGASGGHVGFYGSAGAAKATVSGSRGGNAALASLLTALAATGLIVDSSTA